MHVSSCLVSSVALLYSISSHKFVIIFLISIREKVFNIIIWFTCISFSSSNGTRIFKKDNSLAHMQIWCIVATCAESRVSPTPALQLVLVSEIKTWLHLLSCKFSNRWNNSALYENFRDSLKQLRTTPCYS